MVAVGAIGFAAWGLLLLLPEPKTGEREIRMDGLSETSAVHIGVVGVATGAGGTTVDSSAGNRTLRGADSMG